MGYCLSVCIPNYNREEKLERLIKGIARQVMQEGLQEEVEICISDDCSPRDPSALIGEIKAGFPQVDIQYRRNGRNMGMDYNFLRSVQLAHGSYAWIVGNDDMPEKGALRKIMDIIRTEKGREIDIIVTPFDSFGYDGIFVKTVYPFGEGMIEEALFDTRDKEQFHRLAMAAKDNAALFGFLSNVVFKRSRWIGHGNRFADKMSSIFIQVYMNLQTLAEGAKYLYIPEKIIVNYLDDGTNETLDRTYRIAAGLYDAMDYFFREEEREHIQREVVDIFMASCLLELPNSDVRKKKVDSFVSERMDMLRRYYVKSDRREAFFKGQSVMVYGAGKFGHAAVRELLRCEAEIIGVCDADRSKHGKEVEGCPVFGFDRLAAEYGEREECIVTVANNAHLTAIIRMLLAHRVERIAVIT